MHFTRPLCEGCIHACCRKFLSIFASQEREQFLRMHVKDVQSPTKIWSNRQKERPSLQNGSYSLPFVQSLDIHLIEVAEHQDSNGILWFELQRELESIYYQRIDFVDVAPAWLMNQ